MRVDECRREHEPAPLDDAVAVRAHVEAELGDHAAVDADVEQLVDPLAGVDHAGTADDEIVAGRISAEENRRHQATSSPTAAETPTGPRVSRS